MKEIERKYLLKDSITSLIEKYALKKHKITQFYTIITPNKSVRYRQMDNRYFKTIKHGIGVSRDEEEVEISEKKFQKNLEGRIKDPVEKNRYMFDFEGKEYSIDVFKKDLKGLYILEIEFQSMKAFKEFKLPSVLKAYVIKAVSFDEAFKNKSMVLHGSPQTAYDVNAIFEELKTKNIHELERIAPLLKDLGIHRFFIQVIGIRGKSAESRQEKLQVSRTQWQKTIPEIAQKIARLGITVTYPKVFLSPDEPFECAGLVAENYFIFPNGRVYRCPLCEDFPLHSMHFQDDVLMDAPRINENDLFALHIPEGCVMNRLVQPENLSYNRDGTPKYKIACCLLKEQIRIP